jgi:hypothetical protein
MEEGDFVLSIIGIIEFNKSWIDTEVRDTDLRKEFIDFSYSSIRFEPKSHYKSLKDTEEVVLVREQK